MLRTVSTPVKVKTAGWLSPSPTSKSGRISEICVGNPAWIDETRFATMAGRIKNSNALDALVAEWTRQQTPERVMSLLQGAGVPAGVVSNAEDLSNDLQLNHYNFYRQLNHPYMGNLNFYHPPAIKLSRAEAEFRAPALLGEHTLEICRNILGLSSEEIEDLNGKGVFK